LSRHRIRNRAIAAASALALGAGLFLSLGPSASVASSHREAPLTAADPQIDNTDVYAFVSPDRPKSVTLVSSWIPFEEPAGGPNFYLWAEHTNYDINIDNDGDARPDIIYRWNFTTHYRNANSFIYNNGPVTSLNDKNLLVYQTYNLTRIMWKGNGHADRDRLLHDAKVVPSNVGAASMPGYNSNLFDAGVISAHHGIKSWVGQSDDPFFLDLRVFDLLYGGNLSEAGDDTLPGFNVNTFAIQVPKGQVRGPHGPVLGVWSTASRPSMRVEKSNGTQTFSGHYVQVSRLGMPLVNEVVVPVGAKDYFNASKPKADAQFLGAVNDPELPHIVNAVYPGLSVPDSNPHKKGIQRDDLIAVFLTGLKGLNQPTHVQPSEMLRLNIDIAPCTSSCSRLGVIGGDVAGFPNGRRLWDDIIDVALRVTEGVLLPNHSSAADTLGDGVNANDVPFLNSFPYVAYPHSGSDPSPHS
jgi:Domain of unknown function (DUF4331)